MNFTQQTLDEISQAGGVFIAGTDTEIGKTVIATALIRQLRENGVAAVGYKPVSAGCHKTAAGLRNEDALAIMQASDPANLDYSACNPVALEPAIAPHIAAQQTGRMIVLDELIAGFQRLQADFPVVVVEGAGGWRTPINPTQGLDDLALQLRLPVMLVVGMRLGCLNHALLSVSAITERACLLGWVANCLQSQMPVLAENIATLEARITAPRLATQDYIP